jgi:hypothetical protein
MDTLRAVVLTLVGIVAVLFIGPMACDFTSGVAPVTNRSFDRRVEVAAEKGALKAIEPMRQALGVAQDSLNSIAACVGQLCSKKPAPVIRRAPATVPPPIFTPPPPPEPEPQQNPFPGAGIFAPTPAGVVEIIDGIIRSARPCCTEQPERREVKKEKSPVEPGCGRSFFHWKCRSDRNR